MSSSSMITGSPFTDQQQQIAFASELIFPDTIPFSEMSAIQCLNWQPQELFHCDSSVITGNSSYLLPQNNALSKKRKADQNYNQNQNTFPQEVQKGVQVKGMCSEEKWNRGNVKKEKCNNSDGSEGSSSKTGKVNNREFQKGDFIHVRARRGQATDSHSLAERVRREKISERMKCLQDLVPGCNKITGKAGMLDEIINYVQSLQRQVEFLSMKLAALNPRLDLSVQNLNLFAKEVFTPYYANLSSETLLSPHLSCLQLQPLQQWCDLPVRTADQTFQAHDDSSGWDTELQSLQHGFFTSTASTNSIISKNFDVGGDHHHINQGFKPHGSTNNFP